MHDSTEREAQYRMLPFPFSSSPGDPRVPEETSVAASLPELVEQAYGVRVDNSEWLSLDRWVPSWIHHRKHATRSCSSETPAGLGTECRYRRQRSKRAVVRRLDFVGLLGQSTLEARPSSVRGSSAAGKAIRHPRAKRRVSWGQGCRQMSGLLM